MSVARYRPARAIDQRIGDGKPALRSSQPRQRRQSPQMCMLESAKRRPSSTPKTSVAGRAHCFAVLQPCSSAIRAAHFAATQAVPPRQELLRPRALLPRSLGVVRSARIVPHASSLLWSSPPAEARPPAPTTRHLPRTQESTAMDSAPAYVKSRCARTRAFAVFGCSLGKTQRDAGPLSDLALRVAPIRTHSSSATKRAYPIRRCRDVCRMAVSKSATPSSTTLARKILFFMRAMAPLTLAFPSYPNAPARSE